MAKLKMEFVSIYAQKNARKAVLEFLQNTGIMDIETSLDDEVTAALPDGYTKESRDEQATVFERNAAVLSSALKILDEKCPEKKGLLSSFSGRREISVDEFYSAKDKTAELLKVANRIVELERKTAESKAEILRLTLGIEQLSAYKNLDVPLSFSGTAKTSAFIGSVAGVYNLEQLTLRLTEAAPDIDFHLEIFEVSTDQTYIFITCEKVNEQALSSALKPLSFARPAQNTSKTAREKIASREERIAVLNKNIEDFTDELKELSSYKRSLENLTDYLNARANKYRTISQICQTEHTILIRGYVASVDMPYLCEKLERIGAVVESEPADETKAPVKLKNNWFARPAQTITQMYSLPSSTDIDPTPLTGFFYYLFFGMMLADLGYGILLTLGSLFLIKKFKPEPKMRQSLWLFVYCGISTALWGLFYGSCFGDFIPVFSEAFFGYKVTLPAVIDPMNGGAVSLLILSLVLGFIQIIAGLIAKAVTCIKNKDILGALFDSGLWIVTLLGLGLLALSFAGIPWALNVGMYTAIAGALGLVLTQGRSKKGFGKVVSGLASLYDITGYISDLLSFSRLMALGLTSAAMGAVFNKIGTLAGKGIVGIIVLLIIFPLGHAISLGLNALGAYVHTLRLQYVELFSKFYDGGGKEFLPFNLKSKFVRIKEDK